MIDTHITTPTRFVDVEGTRFAYRRWGNADSSQPPLLFLQHFRGGMDNWGSTDDGWACPKPRSQPRTSASSMLARAVEEEPLSESMLEATLEHRFAARIEVPRFFPSA